MMNDRLARTHFFSLQTQTDHLRSSYLEEVQKFRQYRFPQVGLCLSSYRHPVKACQSCQGSPLQRFH